MTNSIRDIPFFRGLSDAEIEQVGACLHRKSFVKGETLFLEGAVCDRVFFVREGRVKLYRLGNSGREQILDTLGPGDTCACHSGETAWNCVSTAEAETDVDVWFLSKERYADLLHTNPRVTRSLNLLFAERLRCLSSLLEEVSLKDSKKRLVKFLLSLPTSHEADGDTIEVPFTREELAQRLGMARETVARQLYALKRKKLIDIHSRCIHIRNKAALEKLLNA